MLFMIQRIAQIRLENLAKTFRSVAVTGPRQSGKTTLCRAVFPEKPYVFLENPDILEYAQTDPRGFLSQYKNGAILDEIQKTPHLFSYLQQILDETKQKGLFIMTSSNNFILQENISQSLSGRIAYLQLLPLSLTELQGNYLKPEYAWHLLHGGYPEVIAEDIEPTDWFPNYISTYIERDVRQLKNINNLALFTKLLRMCAGRTGQILNMSALANDCGIDQKTVAAWLGVLQSSFIVYLLKPFYNNFNKRITKTPKLYFYDTGLACSLLSIKTTEQMATHAAKGALFENLIVSELLKDKFNKGETNNLYYWRDKTGNEVDILTEEEGKLTAIELKAGETISNDYFKGLNYFSALASNNPEKILVYGGNQSQSRSNGIVVKPWNEFL
jgi:uncharacterized protein